MKKLIRTVCCALSAATIFVAGSCSTSGGTRETVKGTLSIASFEGGYGATWTKALAEAYGKANPDIKVEVKCDPLVRDDAKTALDTGYSSSDLFFIDGLSIERYCENADGARIQDISELYELSPKAGNKEENILIKDKIVPEIVSEMMYGGDRDEYKGKYYTAPSPSGPCSLILNVTALDSVFGAGKWREPKTTDELIALCDAIAGAGATVSIAGVTRDVYPFIYAGDAIDYWRYLTFPWIAQYEGLEAYERFLDCRGADGAYSAAAYQPEGKRVAYDVLETIIKRSNGYTDTSSMNNKFTASQKYFFQGRACMYVTGDWLEREMEDNTNIDCELRMIRVPVVSALAEKIESVYGVSFGQDSVEKDKKLAEIVAAVDAGDSAPEGVGEEVFAAVKEARSITFSLANSAVGFVPSASVNKDLAIDFLRFMYSDEGIQIVLDESKSYLPVVNASSINARGELSAFRKSVNVISRGVTKYISATSHDPIHYRAGLDVYIGNEMPETALGKKSGYLTAEEYLAKEAKVLAEKWNDFMRVV